MTDTIVWEITAEERRQQVRLFIAHAWLLFVALVVITPFLYLNTFLDIKLHGFDGVQHVIIYSAVGVFVTIMLLSFVNKFFHYKNQKYFLDEIGIRIITNKKEKMFSWENFEYFHNYSARTSMNNRPFRGTLGQTSNEIKSNLKQLSQEVEGGIFYLKKKPVSFFRFCKVFVVVRADQSNTGIVLGFLRKHLQERPMNYASDLGLVFYKGK